MTSLNGNILPVPGEFPSQSPVGRGTLMLSLICALTSGWVNNRDGGELRRHHAHYDVTVMEALSSVCTTKRRREGLGSVCWYCDELEIVTKCSKLMPVPRSDTGNFTEGLAFFFLGLLLLSWSICQKLSVPTVIQVWRLKILPLCEKTNKQKTNNNNTKHLDNIFCKNKTKKLSFGTGFKRGPDFLHAPAQSHVQGTRHFKVCRQRLCIGTPPRFGGRLFHLLISRQNEVCWMSHVMGAATSEKKYELKAENLKNAPLLVPFLEQQTDMRAVY